MHNNEHNNLFCNVYLKYILFYLTGNDGQRLSDTIRIFYGASRGYIVYVVPRHIFSDVTEVSITKYEVIGADREHFLISDNVVKVDEYPRLSKPVGSEYSISIQVTTINNANTDLVAKLDLIIIVSGKNRHAPQFTAGSTKIEVFRFTAAGRRIGQTEAVDRDTEEYNRQITYSLIRPHPLPVTIDATTGILMATSYLRDVSSVCQVEVMATDDGSPKMSSATNLTLLVRDISGKSQWNDASKISFCETQI